MTRRINDKDHMKWPLGAIEELKRDI